MTRDIITVKDTTSLHEVAVLMEQRGIKRVPVMRAGKVVGIVSRANLLRALASVHRELPTSDRTDAAIRNRILREIGKQDWAYSSDVDVVVRNGVADLWGTISDEEQREALKVLVRGFRGSRELKITCDGAVK